MDKYEVRVDIVKLHEGKLREELMQIWTIRADNMKEANETAIKFAYRFMDDENADYVKNVMIRRLGHA